MSWNGKAFIDTRLAMGLISAACCYQSDTEIIANIVSRQTHVLVYLDNFGRAEMPGKATRSFNLLGQSLANIGLEKAHKKAFSPTVTYAYFTSD